MVTKHLDLDLGHHEYPLLESTIVENHPACNQYCVGIDLNEPEADLDPEEAETDLDPEEAEADLDPEEATETENVVDVENVTDCSLNLVLEESFEDEIGVVDNNKKRKHIEPLKVVFVGQLPRLFSIQNIPVKRRRKNIKW